MTARLRPSRLAVWLTAGALLLSGAGISSAATVSGTLDGALSMDQTGSAGYTIPITVPPGTAGMQPSLSLSYNSNRGNGMLGQGWTLQGLSAISRCPKTKAQDNEHGSIGYDADDRFCLDGSRLVAVRGTYGRSGTEYRTEIDSFVKVVSRGTAGSGPQYWEVWTKSGQKMEYGKTASSRVEATGQTAVRQWKLNRVEDTVGNYLTVSYAEDAADGFAYPSRIDYGGHRQGSVTQAPYASVRFTYGARHDDLVLMQGGSRVEVDKRLTNIRTYVGATLVSDYRLSYSSTGLPQPSRIVHIRHCDGVGDCLPGVSLTWNSLGDGSLSTARPSAPQTSGDYATYIPLTGDFDGDGISDIAWTQTSSNSNMTRSFGAYAHSHATDESITISNFRITREGRTVPLTAGTHYSISKSGTRGTLRFLSTAPIRANDRVQFNWRSTWQAPTFGSGYSHWRKGSEDYRVSPGTLIVGIASGRENSTLATLQLSVPNRNGNHSGYIPLAGDFNGDGISDLAWTHQGNHGLQIYAALSQGGGTLASAQYSRPKSDDSRDYRTPLVGDFNGDGVSDLAWTHQGSRGLRAYVALGYGNGRFAAAVSSVPRSSSVSDQYKASAADFNGDGVSDLAWTHQDSTGLKAYIALSQGDGTLASAQYTAASATSTRHYEDAVIGDFNGDRVLDIAWTRAYSSGLRAYVALGKGDGRLDAPIYSSPQASGNRAGYTPSAGDFNGDGISDIAWTHQGSFGLRAYVALGKSDGKLAMVESSMAGSSGVSSQYGALVGDFNGDGVSDIIWTRAYNGGLSVYASVAEVPNDFGQISRIASGNGSTFRLDHELLSASGSTVYTKDSGTARCRLPCRDIQAPVQVVKSVVKDHGDGLTERITYRYGGAKTDLAGRGFKGFRWMEATDTRTGIVSRTVYRQDFPYVGQVASSSRYVGSSARTHLDTEANTWSSLSLNGGKTKFVYISSSTAKTYELEDGANNRPVTTVRNASRYDSYGNPTSITVTTTGAGGTFRKVTTNTYANTTSKWYLGRLTCAKVRSEAPGETAVTRTSGFAYSSTTGLLTKEAVEPGSGTIPGCVSALSASDLEDISLTTAYLYDKYGNRRQATTSGSGVESRSTRTVWGERAACGAVTANGRFPVSVRNALGHANENWHSGAFGTVLQSRDANELETRMEYDGFGRPIRTVQPDGSQVVVQYRNCTEVGLICPPQAVRAVLTDRTGAASVIRYLDRRGQVVRTETEGFDGTAIHQDTVYDAAGQVVRKSRAYFSGETAQWSRYTYDKLGRVKSETLPNGNVTETNYDGLVGGWLRERRHVRASLGALARTTVRAHDALGRTVRTTDPAGNATGFAYTESGQRRKVTAANGSVTTRTFDLRGRLLSETDPDRGTQTYHYNALGELMSQTNARGQQVLLKYDLLGRLVRRTESEGVTAWVYDAASAGKGRLAQVSGPGGYLRTHAYDAHGRPASETVTVGGERFTGSRTYDSAGRIATLTYPKSGLVVRHEYTATGYLEKVRKNASCGTVYWTAQTVNAEGQVEELRLGNGVGTTRVFDPKTGLVQSIQSGLGETSAVQDLGYAFDGYGNLTSRENFAQGVYEDFTYDRLNRLTGSTLKNAETDAVLGSKSYRYDAVGNMVNKSDVGASDYVYGAGSAGPHAVTSAGGHTYAYDASGNMASGGGRTLTWASFQKPLTMAKGSTTSTFEYGPERKRVRQVKVKGSVTETITYVGGLYEQVSKTGVATEHVHYIFAGGVRVAVETASEAAGSSAELRYLHPDHLGSVDAVTDAAGAVVERLSFGAFGERRVAQGATAWQDSALSLTSAETRRGFTGHEQLDDFGLVHMNGRVYDPQLGRFLSPDPFVQFALSSQGYNRYTYANNNPLSFTDPSGYFFKSLFRKVKKLVRKVFKSKVVRAAAAVAVAAYGGPAGSSLLGFSTGSVGASVIGGFGAGLIASGGDIKAAIIGGLSGGALGFSGCFSACSGTSGLSVAELIARGVVDQVFSNRSRSAEAHAGNVQTAQAQTVAATSLGGTVSTVGGTKFANGAITRAFQYAIGEFRRSILLPIERMSFDVDVNDATGRHHYSIRARICNAGPACNMELAGQVFEHVNANDIPFTNNDLGPGRRDLRNPLDGGVDPVHHEEYPGSLKSVNETLPGHRYHPGNVTHRVHFQDGALYYEVVGEGTGSHPYGNNASGFIVFTPGVYHALRKFGF